MATHDYSLANQTGANFRADLNNALTAILTNNSSDSEPSTTSAYMWWYDTTNHLLKMRNGTDDAWITILDLVDGSTTPKYDTIQPNSGTDLDLNDAGGTTRMAIADGGNTVLYDEGGDASLTIDTSGNTTLAGTANNIGTVTSGTFNGSLGTNVTGLSASQDLSSSASKDFTGIPSGVKYIIINCYGVSMADPSGTDLLIQIGDSGGIESSSYITSSAIIGSATAYVTNTGGFIVGLGAHGRVFYGHVHLTNVDTNRWLSTHNGSITTTLAVTGGGQHSLSDTLTQIRVKSASGANFDSGLVSVTYYT